MHFHNLFALLCYYYLSIVLVIDLKYFCVSMLLLSATFCLMMISLLITNTTISALSECHRLLFSSLLKCYGSSKIKLDFDWERKCITAFKFTVSALIPIDTKW